MGASLKEHVHRIPRCQFFLDAVAEEQLFAHDRGVKSGSYGVRHLIGDTFFVRVFDLGHERPDGVTLAIGMFFHRSGA